MKILADDKIPLVTELFGPHAEIIQKAGALITAADLKDIDLLLVRTVTRVDKDLLHNTRVRFVGSATAGIDHLDTAYLAKEGIRYFNAKGANAPAVVNYVLACIASLKQQERLNSAARIGIVGVGEVGSRLATALENLGHQVLLNDPPRAEQESDFISTPLSEFRDLDLISLHTPLTHQGKFASYHLLDKNFLSQLKKNSVLINAARGGVIDEQALMQLPILPTLCLDVWENEPAINRELMQNCFIATPHIAGYSLNAKHRATYQLYQQLSPCFNWPLASDNPEEIPLIPANEILKYYDPLQDTYRMKQCLLNSQAPINDFENLRRNYALRTEFKGLLG